MGKLNYERGVFKDTGVNNSNGGIEVKGPNLTDLFLKWVEEQGVPANDLIIWKQTVYARIEDTLCYLKYANLSHDSYYFGFAKKDLSYGVGKSIRAILLCGDKKIEYIFIVDFDELIGLLREGKPVAKKRADYEEYQAKIFPKRNFEMTVTHRHNDPIDMRTFLINIDKNSILPALR